MTEAEAEHNAEPTQAVSLSPSWKDRILWRLFPQPNPTPPDAARFSQIHAENIRVCVDLSRCDMIRLLLSCRCHVVTHIYIVGLGYQEPTGEEATGFSYRSSFYALPPARVDWRRVILGTLIGSWFTLFFFLLWS